MDYSFLKKLVRLPRLFLSVIVLHTALYLSIILYLTGNSDFIRIAKTASIALPPNIILFCGLFYILHKKLKKVLIKLTESGFSTIQKKEEKFINSYSFRGSAFLVLSCAASPVIASIAGYFYGAFSTPTEAAYNIMLGELLAVSLCTSFYFVSKIMLYPLTGYIKFKPLKLLYRFLIPILSSIFLILTLVSAQIYRNNSLKVQESFQKESQIVLEKKKIFMDLQLKGFIAELSAYSAGAKTEIDRKTAWEFLENVAVNGKNPMIEMFFISDSKGRIYTSAGSEADISDREYFKSVMKTGKTLISEPLKSKVTHKNVIVCAVPLKINGKTTGILGATITLDYLKTELIDNNYRGTDFMLLSKDGSIYIYRDDNLINKTIGKDITDNTEFKNVKAIMDSEEKKSFQISFQSKRSTAMKIALNESGMILLLIANNQQMLEGSDKSLIVFMLFIILISIVIYFILWQITNRISKPIHNTIDLFHEIASGNLTVKSNDIVKDEFGELIRNFNVFLSKIKEVMNRALNSSYQLSASAEELSATSNLLADGAQQQAASVEQSTSALEEISASINSIAINAREQSKFADQTYSSMENLRVKVNEVANNSEEAVATAHKATNEAESGNQLMTDTIERMNNIDRSTAEIADVVDLIRGISEQVNLLSLNAAIEAARAGEHGRGFAIVAEEITKLAVQTAESTNAISLLVETGRKEVELGRSQVLATSSALKNILEYINITEETVRKITLSVKEQNTASINVLNDTQRVKEMADSISKATSEQSITNSEMVKNMDKINEQTQSAASAAEEIASSAEEISTQSTLMREQMEFFKVSE
ncbi:MAG TPA: methyl-accepting chemotaxis protein [Spirochaetota bacterium]|nr:methyl-accepting chemotaxis protein [Spirochaetota bacterium]